MKKIGFIVVAVLVAIGMTACPGRDAERIHFATGGVAGVYFPFGTAIATVLNEQFGLDIVVQATGASRDNVLLMEDGEVQMALVQNDVMDYAWNGTGLFAADGAFRGFRTVATLYPEVCQVIAVPGIYSIADLRGRRVSVGAAGSGTEFNARHILEAHGLSFADITVHHMGFGPSADAVRDGIIDAAFITSGAPTPAIVDLALGRPITVLPVEPSAWAILEREFPFYTQYTIRGGTYTGIPHDVTTVAVMATLIVCERLSDETVYTITRGLFEHRDRIALGHARGNDIDSARAVTGVTVPFHSGAARFFRSLGLNVQY